MSASFAIVTQGAEPEYARRIYQNDSQWVPILSALAPWRLSKEVYAFDEKFGKVLRAQMQDTDIPTEALLHLPFFSVYVETPWMNGYHGFFCHLEYDTNNHSKELRFLFLGKNGETEIGILHLDYGTIADGLRRTV